MRTKFVRYGLARAGKVRNQTPHVDQQPKEKEKTGRAKKRELYNNREENHFVNLQQRNFVAK
jgi:small subunit ribosomal protein S30e